MIHFIGAGPGAADLITVRGAKLLGAADCIIYAGSLVNPALLDYAKEDCEIHDSASMTLEEVIAKMRQMEREGKTTVRLHTGDPSLFGAIREQMDVLEAIKMFSEMGLNSTGGLSNNSNGMPKHIRPIMDSALVAMAMMQGLTSAIVNPCDLRLMETIKSCDVFKGNTLYADSYLEI